MNEPPKDGLYLLHISIHGLVRGDQIELGRDADTGGQVKYVIEFAKKLCQDSRVKKVDLMTRQIADAKVDEIYLKPREKICEKGTIVRLPCGPRRYLRKEVLWNYLDQFSDQALLYLRSLGEIPDVIHGHYADSGYIGAQLARLLGVPFIFTGHSLGRVKKQRLKENGMDIAKIEGHYNINKRIDAEEYALDTSSMVVASTEQEVNEQYNTYENYNPKRMVIIPPGVDLATFYPPKRGNESQSILDQINCFLSDPKKPIILTISRADERKNLESLILAYKQNEYLQNETNLVIFAGNRDDIRTMDSGAKKVLSNLLFLIDRYNLYGKVAFPKQHQPDDVPVIYRIAAKSKGVFINPALTEPFGLTLLEAAASGLPIVATNDGGPNAIIGICNNGILVNPLDANQMGKALQAIIQNKNLWREYSRNGIKNVQKYYSWSSHCRKYLNKIQTVLKSKQYRKSYIIGRNSKLPMIRKLIVTDIDNTLLGDDQGLKELIELIQNARENVGLAVATGRSIESAVRIMKEVDVPIPDIFITSVGSEIHYGKKLEIDRTWRTHLNYKWNPSAIRKSLSLLPGLKLQPEINQRAFKISYNIDPEKAPTKREIMRHLRKQKLQVKVIHSHNAFLDILPIRASKGLAVRYLMIKWELNPNHTLIAGDSGNDEEMLVGNTLGVVVGNYSPELRNLHGKPKIYFAENEYARGIIEGIHYYNFLEVE